MGSSEWTDVPAQSAANDGWTDVVPTEVSKPSPNVDLKSKKAKVKFQQQMLEDMIKSGESGGSAADQAAMRDSAATAGDMFPRLSATVRNTVREPARFAGEIASMTLNAPKKVATDVQSLGTAALGLLPGQDFDQRLQQANDLQSNYRPTDYGLTDASRTGELIGAVSNRVLGGGVSGLGQMAGMDKEASDALGTQVEGVVGNTMGVAGVVPVAKGVGAVGRKVYGAGNGVASKVADIAVEKVAPASWTPDGTPTTKGVPSMTDSTQTRLNRIREKSPEVIDNRFRNSSEQLTPAERMSADPLERAKLEEKAQIGLDNVEQLAKEGAIHEHNARGEVVLDAAGQPKPYEVGKGGVVGAVRPAMQALDSVWNEVKTVLRKATNKDVQIPTDGVKGLEKFGKRLITPEELQAEISALNEVLYKTKDGVLSLEDTAKRNVLKKSVGEMNALLDDAVAKALDDGTPGTKDLHKQWGGVRHFTDAVLNGAERKLAGGHNPGVGDVPVHGGLTYKAVGATTRLMNKFFKNPDKAFEAMIRARRAQGNNVRQRVAPETGPVEPMLRDPSTGVLSSGVRETGGEVSRNVQPPAAPPTQMISRSGPGGGETIGTYTGNAPDTGGPVSRSVAPPEAPPVQMISRNVQPPAPDPALTQPVQRNVQPPAPDPALTQPVQRNVGPTGGSIAGTQPVASMEPVPRNVGPTPDNVASDLVRRRVMSVDKKGLPKAVPDAVVARFEAALLGKAADKILKIRAKEMGFNSVEEAIAAIDLSRQGQ